MVVSGRTRWRALMAALGTIVMVAVAPTAGAGESRIGINGARPSDLPLIGQILGGAGFTQSGWLSHAEHVGENWLPGMAVVPLNYPAQLGPLWGSGALSGDESLIAGQQALHAAILAEIAKGNTVSVAGLSLGTMVIDREIAYLHTLPESEAPSPDAITFYVFGGESRGFGQTYAPGRTLPIIGVTFHRIPETRYNTVVVYGQWDGWAAPPDRPWNLLAVANAVMGALYTVNGSNDHSRAARASLEDAILMSDIVNDLGGRTRTYMIPETNLPLTRPLRQLGVPDAFVDRLNELLLPWIRTGYSDLTPQWGPYIDGGRLDWTPATPAPEPPATFVADDDGPADEAATQRMRTDLAADVASGPEPELTVVSGDESTETPDRRDQLRDAQRIELTEPADADARDEDEDEEGPTEPQHADRDEPAAEGGVEDRPESPPADGGDAAQAAAA